MLIKGGKRGQLSLIIIVGIIIVGALVVFLLFRGSIFPLNTTHEFDSVYNYYTDCITQETKSAISILGTQGGHINTDNYQPGSDYAPTSSQFNFLGTPVPYWYYVSGNGLIKEQVPTKAGMEQELSDYIAERVKLSCKFADFYAQGYILQLKEPAVRATIGTSSVSVSVNSQMNIQKGDQVSSRSDFSVDVPSKLGKYYDLALSIYAKEKSEAFLENYSLDVLDLYAPVDGAELSCSGKVWKTRDVVNNLQSGLEANIAALRLNGNYYTMSDPNHKYFVINLPSDEPVKFVYSSQWPQKISIDGDGVNQELMIAQPVGTQQGMGAMGFCYTPYHFVYDMMFPVLIQISDGNELFQFPVVSVIDKNIARNAITSPNVDQTDVDICAGATKDVEVDLYDTSLNTVNGNISYVCFDQRCDLGETKNGVFKGKAPICLNGQVEVRAPGYAQTSQLFSTNKEQLSEVILDKLYTVNISLTVDGKPLDGKAIVTFAGNYSASAAMPEGSQVDLAEGSYNVQVYVYGNSSIVIPATTKTQCTQVASGGFLGFFGSTKEQCYDIQVPETKIDYALSGGGSSDVYLLPSMLENGTLSINVGSLPVPTTMDQLQNNQEAFNSMGVDVS